MNSILQEYPRYNFNYEQECVLGETSSMIKKALKVRPFWSSF